MAGHSVLAEAFDLGIAHAVEVVVGRIVLTHVIHAKKVELPLPPAALGRTMQPRLSASFPLAQRRGVARILRVSIYAR